MRKVLAFAICLLFYSNSYSQNFSLSLLRQSQTAYLQFGNPFSCIVESLPCNSISLSTDNGMISKISPCQYIYRPIKIADTKIIVSKKVNNKVTKIGEYYIRVRNLPDPIASVGGKSEGSFPKGALNAQGGIAANPPGFLGFELSYLVKSFGVTAIRNNEIIFYRYNVGQSFTSEIHTLFATLEKNDVILFSTIIVKMPDEKEVILKPLEFVIE